jgi:hypothetical protein
MDVDSRRGPKKGKAVPENKREAKLEKTSNRATAKSVKPVAKDTNKTRRKNIRPGVLVKTHK